MPCQEGILATFNCSNSKCANNQKLSVVIPKVRIAEMQSCTNKKLRLATKLSKNFVIAVGFNPNSDKAPEYFPARIPWFFSGKINR